MYITVWAARFQPPKWLSWRAWEIHSYSGWQFVITTFNVIPSDSPIMHIIRHGNWEDFREMLRNGQASPWDCNENGLSLFKVGAWRPKIKVMLYSPRTS